jgi:nitric oxide reductase subunit B
MQLYDSVANGYWHARRSAYLMSGTYHTLEWLRVVADVTFLLAGAVPLASAAVRLHLGRSRESAAAAI